VTGENGVFDPGANTVGLTMEGAGKSALKMTTFFFEKLTDLRIPTHYIASDLEAGTMTVKDAEMFGQGLEVICRIRAVGLFYRRDGQYCEEGQPLDAYLEITLKDDESGEPNISKEGLFQLGIKKNEQYKEMNKMTKVISQFVKEELEKNELELYD